MKMLFLFLLSLNALADCTVFVPEKEFYHAGLTINFDFTQVLAAKGYREVNDPSAERKLLLSGVEHEGRFHKAVTTFTLGSVEARESVTCLTQLCSVGDFAKSFRKTYKKFEAVLPECRD